MRMVALGLIVLLMVGPMAGCLGSEDGTEPLVVLTYSAFDGDDEIIDAFTNATGIDVELVRVENSAAILERAMQTAGTDRFDVLLGLDTAYAPIALDAGLLMVHDATLPELALLSEPRHDPDRLVPFDQGYVCLNYDSIYANGTDVPVPTSLWNLTEPQWEGKVAVPSPLGSSPGRVFLAATTQMPIDGNRTWTDWWAAMHANDLILTSGWSQAYEMHYSAGYGVWEAGHIGDARAVLSYCHSPGAEAYWGGGSTSSRALDVPGGTMLQVEYAGIVAGSDATEDARAFLEHLLTSDVQRTFPETNVMYPVLDGLGLPEGAYTNSSIIPNDPVILQADQIHSEMTQWIEAWNDAVGT